MLREYMMRLTEERVRGYDVGMGYEWGGNVSDAERRRVKYAILWLGVAAVVALGVWLVLS